VELMTHVMTLTSAHENTECWTCPECGRVLLIEWEPWYRRVIAPGDEAATHSGGKGGLVMSMEARQDE
jgi:hypothetical protein